MNLRKRISKCGPTVKGGQSTTLCRKQRNFMFDKWSPWLSAGREKVDAKSQQWIPWNKVPNRTFSAKRMIRLRTFPRKDESINERWSRSSNDKKKKTQQKQTQRGQRRHHLCVDAIAFDGVYSPFRRPCHGNLKNAAGSVQKGGCPGS